MIFVKEIFWLFIIPPPFYIFVSLAEMDVWPPS